MLRSSDELDAHGYPGLGLITKGDVPVGGGMHGGLNRHELNAVLTLRAEGVAPGRMELWPSGIIDIAPTVFDLLGRAPAPSMVGCSLLHANGAVPRPRHYETGTGRFGQTLDVVERGQARFLRQGGRIAS